MKSEVKLKDYFQLGNHESQNTFIADEDGEEIPAISLNEFTEESSPGSGTDKVITGIEEYQTKTLSRQTARFFNLANCDVFSKSPSNMNYVMGAEGFISTMMQGLKELIEKIIKFIMGGVNWLIESGKALLGLSANTERREKQAKDVINTQKDMANYLRSVGFPEGLLNLENFMEHLSPDYTEAFKAVHCDTVNSKNHLDTLNDTVDSLLDLQKELSKRSIFVSKSQSKIKDRIDKMYSDLQGNKVVDTNHWRDLLTSINEAVLELDFKRFETRALSIVERHYKKSGDEIQEIKNPEFAAGVNSLRVAIDGIKTKMNNAHPTLLARSALGMLDKIAAVRHTPSRVIHPNYIPLKFGNGADNANKMEFIERSVDENSKFSTQVYINYLAEVAKYVTVTKEINSMLQRCISEQQVYYTFIIKLNAGVVAFISGGLEAFAKHITAVNSNLPVEQRYVSVGKNLFASDDVADSFVSQMNQTFETLHKSGDLLQVKSRIDAFKKQME